MNYKGLAVVNPLKVHIKWNYLLTLIIKSIYSLCVKEIYINNQSQMNNTYNITLDNKETTSFETKRKANAFYKKLANEIGEALNRQRFSYTARITTNY